MRLENRSWLIPIRGKHFGVSLDYETPASFYKSASFESYYWLQVEIP